MAALFKVVGSIKLPGLQAIITHDVGSEAQGLLQGSVSSLRTLAKVYMFCQCMDGWQRSSLWQAPNLAHDMTITGCG